MQPDAGEPAAGEDRDEGVAGLVDDGDAEPDLAPGRGVRDQRQRERPGGENQPRVGQRVLGDRALPDLEERVEDAAQRSRSARWRSSQAGNAARSSSTTWVPASSSSSRVQPPVSTETLTASAASAPSTSWTWSPT